MPHDLQRNDAPVGKADLLDRKLDDPPVVHLPARDDFKVGHRDLLRDNTGLTHGVRDAGTVYLDYNASTPVAPEVLEAMTAAFRDVHGNPLSTHAFGIAARAVVERARAEVAALIGAEADEIVFTSGGTESNNAAIYGVAEALASRGRHLVITAIEHASIEQCCRVLEGRGWAVTRVAVDPHGAIDARAIESAIRRTRRWSR